MKKGFNKYIAAFLLTAFTIYLGMYLVNSITEEKLQSVRNIETSIAINILSLETQFALLQELSCKDISREVLSSELDALSKRLQFMENNLPSSDEELIRLKKYYFLLEIKDFILMQKISKKCGKDMHFILYFYSNSDSCKTCKKQGYVLEGILRDYKNVRVYNFDVDLKLSATETLRKIYSAFGKLPILVIDGKTSFGFKGRDEILSALNLGEEDEQGKAAPSAADKDSK